MRAHLKNSFQPRRRRRCRRLFRPQRIQPTFAALHHLDSSLEYRQPIRPDQQQVHSLVSLPVGWMVRFGWLLPSCCRPDLWEHVFTTKTRASMMLVHMALHYIPPSIFLFMCWKIQRRTIFSFSLLFRSMQAHGIRSFGSTWFCIVFGHEEQQQGEDASHAFSIDM